MSGDGDTEKETTSDEKEMGKEVRERRSEVSESWLAQDCQNFKSQSPAPLDSPQVRATGMVDTWSEAWASGRQGPWWSLHKSLLGSQGSHRLTALPRLQGAQPPPQEAPRCQREARDPVLSHHQWAQWSLCPSRVALPCWRRQLPPGRSQGVVASWLQESDLCPHPPPLGTALSI